MAVVLVTGCAGFIGSRLARACLDRGDDVRGVDVLTDYYDVQQKLVNLSDLRRYDRFVFDPTDLVQASGALVDGVDLVFHEAGQPGVRSSWRQNLGEYLDRNVLATQRLLEACIGSGVVKIVAASSSSVYGNVPSHDVDESVRPAPFSPYGVTKLAAEGLCSSYAANFGVPVVSLRYFTVFGPGQRPDMACHRLFEAALGGKTFDVFGDGEQVRDFTFVDDVVEANLAAAATLVEPGSVINIAGGIRCSLNELITGVELATGRKVAVARHDAQPGDVRQTSADTGLARRLLGWAPRVDVREGLARQHEWHIRRRSAAR